MAWSAPSECPDETSVNGYVTQDLGAAPIDATQVHARGTVKKTSDGRYEVELELGAAGAQSTTMRSLGDANCESLAQAAALVVALAIRAERAPEPVPVAASKRAPKAARFNRHARPFLAALVVADAGTLPKPTLGLGVSAGASIGLVRLEPMLAYFAPQSGTVPDRPGLGARFTLGSALLRACTPFPASELWFAPCLGAGLDWFHASGFGARVSERASTFDAVGLAAALGGWDISSIISLRAELSLVAPLARPEFVVDGVGTVYRRAPIATRAALGLELHF
ncbi:MAG TPA: hypothetical protein VHV51_24030 [Polyangiaceae bacterium]|jgi:hypothetical protein|nr:hypothetical protein [Polyangiaceae bacterium]